MSKTVITPLLKLTVLMLATLAPSAHAEPVWKGWRCELDQASTQAALMESRKAALARSQVPDPIDLTHLTKLTLVTKDDQIFRGSIHTSHQGGPLFARRPHQVSGGTSFEIAKASASPTKLETTLESVDRTGDRYSYSIVLDTQSSTATANEAYFYATSEGPYRGAAMGLFKCTPFNPRTP